MKTLRALVPALSGPAAFFGASIAAGPAGARILASRRADEPLAAATARSGPVMVGGFLGLAVCTLALDARVRGSWMPAVIAPMR